MKQLICGDRNVTNGNQVCLCSQIKGCITAILGASCNLRFAWFQPRLPPGPRRYARGLLRAFVPGGTHKDKEQKQDMVDETKRKGRGPEKLPPDILRSNCISTRLSDAELADLDSKRQALNMARGEYLRCAALDVLPRSIPELNREAWIELARSASNLNQIAHKLAVLFNFDGGEEALDGLELAKLAKGELAIFRQALIGANLESQD